MNIKTTVIISVREESCSVPDAVCYRPIEFGVILYEECANL
jgi:hypothetical protein